MFTEILRIKPKLDQSDLRNMERSLTRRFARVAKSFGRGLRNVLKGGGVLGAIGVVVNALLDPLRQVNETLDRILGTAGNLQDFSTQLGTTPGNLAFLKTIAESAGIGEDRLIKTLSRFQTEIGRAKADPSAPSLVREFVGIDDTAEAFFQFLQSLQKMDKDLRSAIGQQVIGERGIIEFTGLLNTNLIERYKELGLDRISPQQVSESVTRLDEKATLDNILKAQRALTELVDASNKITEQTIRERNRAAQSEQDRQLDRISTIEDAIAITQSMDSTLDGISKVMNELVGFVGEILGAVKRLVGLEGKFTEIIEFISAFRKGTFSKFMGRIGRGE